MEKPPLKTIDEWGKQLESNSLEANEVAALDLAFPLFRELDDRLASDTGEWSPFQAGLGSKNIVRWKGKGTPFCR